MKKECSTLTPQSAHLYQVLCQMSHFQTYENRHASLVANISHALHLWGLIFCKTDNILLQNVGFIFSSWWESQISGNRDLV